MTRSPNLDSVLDELVEAGVLVPTSSGDLELSDEFEELRDECRQRIEECDEQEFMALESDYVQNTTSEDVSRAVVGDAVAIREMVESFSSRQTILSAEALTRFDDPPKSEGAPEGFTPLYARDIVPFMNQFHAASVYFWREDCDPCDSIRAKLEMIVNDLAEDDALGLGAVYGPEDPELLSSQFDVGAAPTILFCKDGRIDSRLVGDHTAEAIRRELALIRES